VAGAADDKGLAPFPGHEGRPRWLARPGRAELGESGDVVDCHRGAMIAQLAPPPAEPVGQLLARGVDRDRGGVSDDRALVAFESYPAKPCYQVLLALALEAGLGGQKSQVGLSYARKPLRSSCKPTCGR
jgi:hypothetical protein